jgi:hypothetical protein
LLNTWKRRDTDLMKKMKDSRFKIQDSWCILQQPIMSCWLVASEKMKTRNYTGEEAEALAVGTTECTLIPQNVSLSCTISRSIGPL